MRVIVDSSRKSNMSEDDDGPDRQTEEHFHEGMSDHEDNPHIIQYVH